MQLEEGLYLAGPESILSVLQSTPKDMRDVILVGHNPGISMLAGLLNNPALTIELGTLGIVALTFNGQWQDLILACANSKPPMTTRLFCNPQKIIKQGI